MSGVGNHQATPDMAGGRSAAISIGGIVAVIGVVFILVVTWEFVLADGFLSKNADDPRPQTAADKWVSVLKIMTFSAAALAISCLIRTRQRPVESAEERRISDAEVRYASIVEAEPQCVKLMDRAGRLLDMNPAGLSIIAAPSFDDVKGLDVRELVLPPDRPAFDGLLERVFEGEGGELEFQIETLDGEIKWMSTHAVPLFAADGSVSTYMAVTHDVTEKKAVDQELISAKNAAEEANNQMSVFLANVSHEFRTPLNAILGFTQMMMLPGFKPTDKDKYLDYLDAIEKAGRQLSTVVEDLLDTSRLAAGVVDLTISKVDLIGQLDSVALMVSQEAAAKSIRLETSSDLASCCVWADEARVRQILTNLLDNAIKFTPAGGSVVGSVGVLDDGAVEVCVSDSGIGIKADLIPEITKPFFRGGNAETRSYQGSGLGLALVSEFAKLHDAAFDIESAPGAGTKVRVTFPADKVVGWQAEASAPAQAPARAPSDSA